MSQSYSSNFDGVDDPASRENASKFEKFQKWVFSTTFLNYAFAHWTRKSYTNVKVSLMGAGVSPLTLAAMDSGFMFTYAGGSFITGQLGDRFSPVVVVGLGLLGSTFCLLMILFGASTSIVQSAALCGTWFLSCQLLHGLFQATGGPVTIICM
jgi:sugar phosphate permease